MVALTQRATPTSVISTCQGLTKTTEYSGGLGKLIITRHASPVDSTRGFYYPQKAENPMSSKIVLNPGLTWETLPASQEYVSINRDVLVNRLRHCADEWREARDSQNLDDVMGSVGALLVDFCFMIELTPTEIVNILSGQPAPDKADELATL